MGRLILILGGVRSGKSQFAERLAKRWERVLYVAPAQAGDEEMRRRIEEHKRLRPGTWRTLEAPYNIGEALKRSLSSEEAILLDCLTMLISNILMADPHYPFEDAGDHERVKKSTHEEVDSLATIARDKSVELIIVSNEVGMEVIPPYPAGRLFQDILGRANQFLAERAAEVYLMVAGLPLKLKPVSDS